MGRSYLVFTFQSRYSSKACPRACGWWTVFQLTAPFPQTKRYKSLVTLSLATFPSSASSNLHGYDFSCHRHFFRIPCKNFQQDLNYLFPRQTISVHSKAWRTIIFLFINLARSILFMRHACSAVGIYTESGFDEFISQSTALTFTHLRLWKKARIHLYL